MAWRIQPQVRILPGQNLAAKAFTVETGDFRDILMLDGPDALGGVGFDRNLLPDRVVAFRHGVRQGSHMLVGIDEFHAGFPLRLAGLSASRAAPPC